MGTGISYYYRESFKSSIIIPHSMTWLEQIKRHIAGIYETMKLEGS